MTHIPDRASLSYGGGRQSTAILVLMKRGIVPSRLALFANTGDDSENPDTLDYVRNVAVPWAEHHGIRIVEVTRTYADGRPYPTLLEFMGREGGRSTPIPVRLRSGAPASRTCTAEWKGKALARWREQHLGASEDRPALAYIGFSTDEAERCNKKKASPGERIEYPLIDLRMNLADCEALIRDEGLPVPPKSSCWFCPWTPTWRWAEIRRDDPERFDAAADLEEFLSDRSRFYGKGPMTLTDTQRPLREIQAAQETLPFAESYGGGCDEGGCWT